MRDFSVIVKAKDLAAYLFGATQKSPKRFRFSLAGRIRALCLDIVGGLYAVNDTWVDARAPDCRERFVQRLDRQHKVVRVLRRDSVRRMKRQLKHFQEAYRRGEINMEEIEGVFTVGWATRSTRTPGCFAGRCWSVLCLRRRVTTYEEENTAIRLDLYSARFLGAARVRGGGAGCN